MAQTINIQETVNSVDAMREILYAYMALFLLEITRSVDISVLQINQL